MATHTRWVWLTKVGDERVLAFCYRDATAGPSAKGDVVSEPPTPEQIRAAVDTPSKTVREPERFGAVPLAPAEVLAMGLPKDPPWIGFFEDKPIPPPRGEPSRTVRTVAMREGVPVEGAYVRMGYVFGRLREMLSLDARSSDAAGVCVFPLAPMPDPTQRVVAIASAHGAISKLVEIPAAGDAILELLPAGEIVGTVTRAGVPVRAQLTIWSGDGGLLSVERAEADGRYRLGGVVPATYTIEVRGIDPQTHNSSGTTSYEEVIVLPGERVHRDFSLVVGRSIHIRVHLQSDADSCIGYLFEGDHQPATSEALHELCRTLDRRAWCATNSSATKDRVLRTKLVDVPPGTYTLCTYPKRFTSGVAPNQAVVRRTVIVEDEDLEVTLEAPAYAEAEPPMHVPPATKTRANPPPLPRQAPTEADEEHWHDPDALIDFALSANERELLQSGIATWGGPAHPTDELARAMGFRDVDALYREGTTLIAALSERTPMTQRQWLQCLLATEIVFGSATLGAGLSFEAVTGIGDAQAFEALRGIQRVVGRRVRGLVVAGRFGTRSRPPSTPKPLPPVFHLFASNTLTATLRLQQLSIRAAETNRSLFQVDIRQLFDITYQPGKLIFTGVFRRMRGAVRYSHTITGSSPDLADLAEVLRGRLKPSGPPIDVDPATVKQRAGELDGKVVCVEGIWEREGDRSTLGDLTVVSDGPAGRWQVALTGRVTVHGDLVELAPVETVLLNCWSDDKLAVLEHKRELMVGERKVQFELRSDDVWRVRIDGRPIPMTVRKKLTTTNVNTHTREDKASPAAWAPLGPALRASDHWQVELGVRTRLRCDWSTSAECFNTVIYNSHDVELVFPGDLSSVAISFEEYSDMSS